MMLTDKTRAQNATWLLVLLSTALMLFQGSPAYADLDEAPLSTLEPHPQATWLNHVRIGTRVAHLSLDDHSRVPVDANGNGTISAAEVLAVSYMGSITELDAEQWYLPSRLYAQWEFSPYWGVELGWEDYEVSTSTYWDGHTDGAFSLSGPLVGVYAKYTNRSRFSPYVQAGIAWFGSRFSADQRWTVMMDEETFQDWLAAGAPETWFDGLRQHLDADDAFATFVMTGCEVFLREDLSLELFVRWIDVDVYAHWYNTKLFFDGANPEGERRVSLDNGSFRFPMSTTAFGLGIQYSF